ncbi:hypothetical protein Dip510_001496 [Elusimicrobium posterum]|uniref:hypothetical protein n=1 Tax=Elusimicrobium posterum TaxID=3116653 RepID=UPI003C75A6F5
MKKLLLILISSFLAAPLLAQASSFLNTYDPASYSGKKYTPASCPVYSTLRIELISYYGKKDFSDPERTTGWYRVDDFLKWLKKNEQSVIDRFHKADISPDSLCPDLKKGDTISAKTLAGLAGSFYIYDKFIPREQQTNIPFFRETMHGGLAGKAQDYRTPGKITVPINVTAPEAINSAMHEATHFLKNIGKSQEMLTETATIFVQQQYGLPVYKNLKKFHRGARNPLTALRDFDFNIYMEYPDALFALFLSNDLKKRGITTAVELSPQTNSLEAPLLLPGLVLNILVFNKNLAAVELGVKYAETLEGVKKILPPGALLPAQEKKKTLASAEDKFYMVTKTIDGQWAVRIFQKVPFEHFSARFTKDAALTEKIDRYLKELAKEMEQQINIKDYAALFNNACDDDLNCVFIYDQLTRQVSLTALDRDFIETKMTGYHAQIMPVILKQTEKEMRYNNAKMPPVPEGYK